MTLTGGDSYQATIPAQPDGTRVDYAVTGDGRRRSNTTFALGYFSGVTPIQSLHALTAQGRAALQRLRGTDSGHGHRAPASAPAPTTTTCRTSTGAVNVYRSTDTPTAFTSTTPGQVVEVLRPDRLQRRPAAPRHHRIGRERHRRRTASSCCRRTRRPRRRPSTIAGARPSIRSRSRDSSSRSRTASIVSGTIPATPQPLDAFVTISRRHRHVLDEDRSRHRRRGLHAGGDVHGGRHRPAGRLPAAVRLRLQRHAAQPRRPRRRGAGAADAADDRRRARRSGQQRRRHTRRRLHSGSAEPGRAACTAPSRRSISAAATASSTTSRTPPAASISSARRLNFGPFAIGDTVEAIGTVTHFNGLTELTVTALSLISHGTPPAPQVDHAVAARQRRRRRGVRGTARPHRQRHGHRADCSRRRTPSGNVTIADATGTGTLRVDSDTDIDGTATPPSAHVLGHRRSSASSTLGAVRQRLPAAAAAAEPTSSPPADRDPH